MHQGSSPGRARLKLRAGSAGIHVFDRTTGLNLLINEAQLPVSAWAAAPRYVSIALLNACDLRCPYCYAPKHPAKLDTTRVFRWVDELDENGCLGVGFGGGEPTLHPDFPELCRYVSQETGMAVTFTTHGHKLDERLAAKLRGNVHFIRVSMDGVGDTYEELRGRAFPLLLDRIEVVRGIAPFGINFVVNSMTLPDLGAAIALAATVGASEFLLLPEQRVPGRKGIDTRSIQELQEWVDAYEGPIPLSVSETNAADLPTCNALAEETGLRAFAHIDASGILKRSSYHSDGVLIGEDGVINALRQLDPK